MILSSNVLALLCEQYVHEMANSIFYARLQSWAEMRGLNGTAAFFAKQAKGEVDHATMVLDYIHARNEELEIPAGVDLSIVRPSNFLECFTLAQMRERLTTDKIARIKAQSEVESDMATCAWLMQPGNLVMEQIEEENVIQTILDRIKARASMVSLDGQEVTPAEAPGAIIHDIDVWIGSLA